jgi:predicted amidohydrolase
LRVAAVQLNSTADRAANLAVADRLVRAAAADGARLIVLPEKWTAMGSEQDMRAAAERIEEGPSLRWAREIARELRIDLVAGSILETLAGSDKLANTSVHVAPDGDIRAVYRKIHMFDVEVDGRTYRESELEEPGDRIVLSYAAGEVELGLSICYDLRFPELYRALAAQGAEVLCVPAAFTARTGQAHWEPLLRARAIENQCFLIAPGQHGSHAGGRSTHGHSLILDPWGEILAQQAAGDGVVAAALPRQRLEQVRSSFPALTHRRLGV